MTNNLFLPALIGLVIAAFVALILALRPSSLIYDRLLALNFVGTLTVLFIAVIGFFFGRPEFLDIAIVYALINFIGTIAVLKYMKTDNEGAADLGGLAASPATPIRCRTKPMTPLDVISGVLLIAGSSLVVTSAFGVLRFKDTFMKLHASSVAETGGLLLLVAGMLLQCPNWLVAIKLIIVALVLMLTNPVSSHALARAALYDGFRPKLCDKTMADTADSVNSKVSGEGK